MQKYDDYGLSIVMDANKGFKKNNCIEGCNKIQIEESKSQLIRDLLKYSQKKDVKSYFDMLKHFRLSVKDKNYSNNNFGKYHWKNNLGYNQKRKNQGLVPPLQADGCQLLGVEILDTNVNLVKNLNISDRNNYTQGDLLNSFATQQQNCGSMNVTTTGSRSNYQNYNNNSNHYINFNTNSNSNNINKQKKQQVKTEAGLITPNQKHNNNNLTNHNNNHDYNHQQPVLGNNKNEELTGGITIQIKAKTSKKKKNSKK